MADLAETRKFCVQSLRKVPKKCGVPLVQDSASRGNVEEFAQAVLNSGGPLEEKKLLGAQAWNTLQRLEGAAKSGQAP